MKHSFLNLLIKLGTFQAQARRHPWGWKRGQTKPRPTWKIWVGCRLPPTIRAGRASARQKVSAFISFFSRCSPGNFASKVLKSHWEMVQVWGPQTSENQRTLETVLPPPPIQTQIPFAPFQTPQMMGLCSSCVTLFLAWEFCTHVFPLIFLLLSQCPMSQQPPHLAVVSSPAIFVLSSVVSHSAEDPYLQSHLIYILQWYLLTPGVSTISATPSDVQHPSSTPQMSQAPLCAFCFLVEFSSAACLSVRQCLGTGSHPRVTRRARTMPILQITAS